MKNVLMLVGCGIFWIWIFGTVENFVITLITTIGVIAVMALVFLPLLVASGDNKQ